MCCTWFGLSGKGRSNHRQYSTKKWLPLFVMKYYWTKGTWTDGKKNLSQIGFITRFMNGAPQEIKVKINESWQLKFYQENSTERKFNQEFCGKEP